MALSQLTLATPKLEQDPALATERLANGMEIAVFKNSEPPNRVSMRLLVRRGSLCETESERGLAHFMEHMAFNGTRHFPAGEMVEYFQRLGMAFGADTNAHTGFTETVYKIDMPEASEKLIDDGMTLFRDYCDAMLLAPEEIEKERGVILAEKNSRDTQEYRKVVKEIAHIYKGSTFADRMPIGVESVIKNAKRGDFQKFYAAAYRPENAVLVVAGDVEPKKILEMARKRFEGFKASESQPARKAEFGSLEKSAGAFPFDGKAPEIDALYDCTENSPRAYASISVSKEKAGEKDSLERRARLFRLKAIASALTSRFLRTASLPDSKITQGDASIFEFDSFCETFSVSAEAPVGGAFDALEEALRQILDAENLAEHEIEDAKMKIVDELKSAVKAAPTRKSNILANALVACLSKGKVFNSPQNSLEIAAYAFEGFGAKEAVGLLKEALSGGKIKAFVSDAKKCGDGELGEKVSEAFESASKSRRGAGAFARARLKFSQFGAEGKIAERREIASLGITQLRFENGVRLNFKKTDFSKDEILVKVSFGKGILDIPADKPELYCAVDAVRTGGTKFQSAGEIDAAKYLMKTSDAMGIDGNAFTYSMKTTAHDFADAMRHAATMFADAGFRDDGLPALRKCADEFYLEYDTEPLAKSRFLPYKIMKSALSKLPGARENFAKIKMADIEKWLSPILKKSYMEISIVGDVGEKEAVALAARTFGALPPRDGENPAPRSRLEFIPAGSKISETYKTTDEPRSLALTVWLSSGKTEMKKMRADNILGEILDDVLRKEIREAQGKVYSPFAYNNSSAWIKDTGFMTAATFVVPEYNAEMLKRFGECAQRVVNSISEDEFERAKTPLLKGVEANKRKNVYWLEAVLNMSQCRPENIKLAETIESGYAEVSLEDVRKRAGEIFSKPPYSADIMPANDKKVLKK